MASSKSQGVKDMLQKFSLKAKQVVLNLSEPAVKCLEATNSDKWGPHGQLMTDIAEGSFDAEKFKEVWDVLKKRMAEGTGEKWRLTYKSLLVIEFLVKQSSQHVVQVVLENVGLIQDLQKFQYKDEAGKDWGLNVRNRAKELCALLGNPDRIREERAKARANKEKYKGLSKATASGMGTYGEGVEGLEGRPPSAWGRDSEIGSRGGYESTDLVQGGGALQEAAEEGEDEPRAATARRINSLKQAGVVGRETAAPLPAPLPAPSPAKPAAPVAAPAPAPAMDGFEAFPAEPAVVAVAKPSLRALTESRKGGPKKLGDVRVDPSIAASLGSLRIASPTPAAPASPSRAALERERVEKLVDVLGTASPPKSPGTAAPAAAGFFDADFGTPTSCPALTPLASPAPAAMAAAPALDDPFAVLPGERKPTSLAQQILGPAGPGSPGNGAGALAAKAHATNNPFGAPTFSLTAAAAMAAAPLPEAMFSALTGPVFGTSYGQGSVGSPVAAGRAWPSPSTGPAMKASPLKVSSPAAPAAPRDDPFSAFNPFK